MLLMIQFVSLYQVKVVTGDQKNLAVIVEKLHVLFSQIVRNLVV